ncbi:MAG TPA: four helix bundle protein [Anaerolineales bacterium]|nr:four helix bundle protein [Anaerolineales bacterium]
MSDYRDLVFYQKAGEVVKGINDLIKTWPKTMQAQEISRQVLRSAMSIGANIAEGHGRHEGSEYIHYLIIAQGSANETDHWLHTVIDLGLSPKTNIESLLRKNNEVRRMLVSSINTLKSKRAGYKTREEDSSYNIEAQLSDD